MTSRRTMISGFTALAALGAPSLDSAQEAAAPAGGLTRVRIDAERVCARVNPMIFGQFIEHLGRCIYGGIYEERSALSDEKGFRRDVLGAVRRLNPPILRWPGGNFVSSYDWKDGIGPKDQRPRRFDTAWYAEESNRFGTNDFIEYCRKIGTQPYICINLGTGSLQDATDWVEYCNGTGDTHYANLRRKHGYPQPHNVKYWGLGNEMYGVWQAGHKSAVDYAKVALEAGKMMKWTDPSISLIACGSSSPDWNATVIETVGPIADYVSVHMYAGSDDYYELLGTVRRAESLLRTADSVIEIAESKRMEGRTGDIGFPLRSKRLEIAFDEWNVWYRRRDGREREVKDKLEEPYNLRDALWTASMIHLFQRWGNKVTMANLAQMVNVIAPIFTSPKGLFLQPTFFPLELYRRESGDRVVDSWTRGPSVKTQRYGSLEYLDVCVTRDSAGDLAIGVVNLHRDSPLRAEFEILGANPAASGRVYQVTGPSPDSRNTFEAPDVVGLAARDHSGFGNKFSFEFPKHSITLLKFRA